MKYTRKTGVVRLQVAVLEVESIPEGAEIIVDDCLYEIFFNIDKVQHADVGDEFDHADDLDDDRDRQGEDNMGEDQEMEDIHDSNADKSTSSGTGQFSNVMPKANDPKPTANGELAEEALVEKEVATVSCVVALAAAVRDTAGPGQSRVCGRCASPGSGYCRGR